MQEPIPSQRWTLRTGRTGFLALVAVVGLFLVVIVRKAWVTDDAYITFRTIDNLVHGYGLRWNPAERVQVYTHPLWMLLMIGCRLLSGEFFYSAIGLNVALSLVAVVILVFRIARTTESAFLAAAILTLSRAFTDFSTSGLENALSHALLAALLLLSFRRAGQRDSRNLLLLSLLSALCILNRFDNALLVLPALVVAWAQTRTPRRTLALGLGFLPLLLWQMFALLYYGFLLPNSAVAKLNTGIGLASMSLQGMRYLLNSLRWDPVSLIVIVCGLAWALASRKRGVWPWGLGVLLYLLYVIRVGGDFMSGRFLTTSLMVSVALLAHLGPGKRTGWTAATIVILLMALPSLSPFFEKNYGEEWHAAIDAHGIADERTFYEGAALWNSWGKEVWPQANVAEDASNLRQQWPRDQLLSRIRTWLFEPGDVWPPLERQRSPGENSNKVVVRGAVGFLGYHIGPSVHILDYHAIGDPLLARLPAIVPDPVLLGFIPRLGAQGWRIGHFTRGIPAGYVQTLASGVNQIRDPALAAYYDQLASITRDPILSRERWRALVDWHRGASRKLMRQYLSNRRGR